MPLITTEIAGHPALDALDNPSRRDWLLAQLDYKHSQEVWKLLQPTTGVRSTRYAVQSLGMHEYVIDMFGTPTMVYRMSTLMAYLDEVDCLVGDVVASEALGDFATLYNAQYINIPVVPQAVSVGENTWPPSLPKQRQYKRRIYHIGIGIDERQMIVWERIE